MKRRNFLTKILLAIPFVGLLAVAGKSGPKRWNTKFHRQAEGRIHRIGMPDPCELDPRRLTTPEQIEDFVQPDESVQFLMTEEQQAFLAPPFVDEWTPEAIDAYVAKNHYYPHDLTDQEWKRYKEECINLPRWKNAKRYVVSRGETSCQKTS